MLPVSTDAARRAATRTWVPGAYVPHPLWAALLALVAGAGLYFLFVLAGQFVALLAIGLLAIPVAVFFWRYPFVGVMMLVLVGSAHSFLMLLVLHFTGTPAVVKGAQLWKEAVILVLLVKVMDEALHRRRSPRFYLLDLLVILFLAYAAVYIAIPSPLADVTLNTRILGFRADTFFLFAYFLGRGLDLSVSRVRVILLAFAAIGFAIALIAVAQFLFPSLSNQVLNQLGFQDYLLLQRGDDAVTVAVRSNDYQGVSIPRASSLLLSDLALAFYTLLTVPIAAAIYVTSNSARQRVLANFFLLTSMATTLFTVTRSAIVALVPLLTLVLLRPRGILVAGLLAVQAAVIVLPALPLLRSAGITPDLLPIVFSPSEGSFNAHLNAARESIETITDDPLGRGLGTAGQVSQREGVQEGITSESWYLHLAVEMGVFASALWALILVSVGVMAITRYLQVKDPWLRALCLGMAGSAVGFTFVSATLQVWDGLTTAIIFWFFTGLMVRARDLDRAQPIAAG